MVLQVLAHPGQVGDEVDAETAEQLRRAHAGQLEQLGGVDRAAAQDDLGAAGQPGGAAALDRAAAGGPGPVLHADRPLALEEDLGDEGAGGHVEVGPAHHRVQVGPGRAEPAAPVDVPVERGEALLPVPVHVVGDRIPGLLHRGEERLEQRAGGRAAFQHQRAVAAPVLVRPGQAGLHLLEVRQAVRVVPVRHARVGGPALVVERVAALEDHPVDAAGPAEYLAPGVVDPAAVQVRLRLGLIPPVVELVPDREGQRGRHVDVHVPRVVRPAGLQHEHPGGGVRGQAVGEGTAGGAAADDDEVVLCRSHLPSQTAGPGREPARHETAATVSDTRGALAASRTGRIAQ